MKIGGLQKFSMIDFPGHICATIFTQGCNFRCPYCHNPELVLPEKFETPISVDEVLSFLSKRVGKLDGVTITGGEPTLHKDLPDLIEQIRKMGFLIKLDTNGTNPDMLEYLILARQVDYFAIDYKGPINKYNMVTCVNADTSKILHSVHLIKKSGMKYEFRSTLVKELLSSEDVVQMTEELGEVRKHYIQKFISTKTLDQTYQEASAFAQTDLSSDIPVIYR